MKKGRTLLELGQELERQRNARQDFIADTRSLSVKTSENQSALSVTLENGICNSFGINELAHQQIAARLQIPYRYYSKMRSEQPALLDNNINAWLNHAPERRMVRTLDGNVRAFLSDRTEGKGIACRSCNECSTQCARRNHLECADGNAASQNIGIICNFNGK